MANEWQSVEHALEYLRRADAIPHRTEGEATLLETRVGFRPAGPGVQPMLGWVPEVDGLAIGNGLGAAGLTIGPLAGRLLADLVTGQRGLPDLAPFDPGGPQGAQADGAPALR